MPGIPIASRLIHPSAPNALTNPLLQDTSVYKAFRTLQTTAVSMGTILSNATDGLPGTFSSGNLDASILRIAPAGLGATLGLPNQWVAGGGDTAIAHLLGRVPIGYIIIAKSGPQDVWSSSTQAWTSTYLYVDTDHSNTHTIMMIF